MLGATTLTARDSNCLVPTRAAIRAPVEGLEGGGEYSYFRFEDGVRVRQYVQNRKDVPAYRAMKAQHEAMRYEVQWQRKRSRGSRDSQ